MKINKLRLSLILLLLIPVLTIAKTSSGQRGTLVVKIYGFKHHSGIVRVALFNNPRAYKAVRKAPGKRFTQGAIKTAYLRISKSKAASWTIRNLPYGNYVIKLHHDENGNGKLDRSFVGKPKEGIGFSNNAKGRFGPPSYEKAKFNFNKKRMIMTIRAMHL